MQQKVRVAVECTKKDRAVCGDGSALEIVIAVGELTKPFNIGMTQTMLSEAYVSQYLLLSHSRRHSRLQQASYHQHHESGYQDLAEGNIEKNQKKDLTRNIRSATWLRQQERNSKLHVLITNDSRVVPICAKR